MKKKQISRKTWRYLRTGLIVFGCLALAAAIYMASKVHDVTITEQELQEKIDEKLPLTTKSGVTINKADVRLTDALTLHAVASAEKLGQHIEGEVITTLHLVYRSGRFYTVPSEIHIERLLFNDLNVGEQTARGIGGIVGSQGVDEEIQKLEETKGLKGSVGRYLRKKKTELTDEDERGAAGGIVQEQTEALVVKGASKALTHIPVYRLPDTLKGSVIKMMITDVEIKDGAMTVYLSFWQLGLHVLVFLVLFIGLIALAIYFPAFFEVASAVIEVASVFDC